MYRRSHTTFAQTVAAATLLLREKEGQCFFTLAAKLRLLLAPLWEGSESRGAATAWPQTLFKQILVACSFYLLSPSDLPLEQTELGTWDGCCVLFFSVHFLESWKLCWDGRRSVPCCPAK